MSCPSWFSHKISIDMPLHVIVPHCYTDWHTISDNIRLCLVNLVSHFHHTSRCCKGVTSSHASLCPAFHHHTVPTLSSQSVSQSKLTFPTLSKEKCWVPCSCLFVKCLFSCFSSSRKCINSSEDVWEGSSRTHSVPASSTYKSMERIREQRHYHHYGLGNGDINIKSTFKLLLDNPLT